MTTVLSQQLNKISLAIGKAPGGPQEAHVSVLYGAREAADTDTQTIYSNALHGLEQLSRADPRFLAYQRSLFSAAALSLDPNKLTATELAGVLKSVKAFLSLLSPHFLSPGCFKTLEFLLRKYRVHSRCAEELVACGLPFHSTTQFVRLVQATKVEGTAWEWLKPMQASGAPLPRATLAQRCVKDKALLKLVCELGKASGHVDHLNRMTVSLYAVLVCEVLVTSPKVDEDVVRLLLPYLLHGVGSDSEGAGVSADYRTASHMILVQLCSIATLAKDFLEVLMQQIVRTAGKGDGGQVVMVLTHLTATQPQLKELPKSVLKALVKMEGLAGMLGALQRKRARSKPLVQLLVAGLCGNPKTTANSQALISLLQNADLGFVAKQIAAAVLQQVDEKEVDPVPTGNLQQILRILDLRYPEQSDAAINEQLQAAEAEHAAKIGSFVGGALSSSARAPLSGQLATFSHAIDAPSAQLRTQAVRELDGMAEADVAFVRDALVRRLADDDPSVLLAVVSGKALLTLPPEEVATTVAGLLRHVRRQYTRPATVKADRKVLRDVVKQALKVVVGLTKAGQVSMTLDVAAACLLNWALASQSTQKLAAHIPGLARQLGHPLLTGLEGAGKSDGSETGVGPANLATVRALAGGLAEAPPGSVAGVVAHLDDHGRCLLLMALSVACHQGSSTARQAVLNMTGEMQTNTPSAPAKGPLLVPNFDDEGLPDSAFLEKLAHSPAHHAPTLFHRALLSALTNASDLKIKDVEGLFDTIGALTLGGSYLPHLGALLTAMGPAAPAFLAAIIGQPEGAVPPAKLVSSLQLVEEAVVSGTAIDVSRMVSCLLAAMTHPAKDVRSATIPAAGCLAKSPKIGNSLRAFLEELVKHGKHIQDSALGLRSLVTQMLDRNAAPASATKKKTPRKGPALTKPVAAEMIRFLTDELARQSVTQSGLNSAQALLQCLPHAALPGELLSASLHLFQRLLLTPNLQGMEQLAEEVAKELLSLFSGVALAALEEGRKSNSDPSPATILASIIAPPRSASPVHTTAVQMAATAVVTEEMFAKLPAASQATLAVALLEAGSHSSDNQARIRAQKALEPLPLNAGLLAPLLQAPTLAPTTPVPTPKRLRMTKGPKDRIHTPPPWQGGGLDSWAGLTSALELLQWKSDIPDTEQLWHPLCATLRFLLTQLATGSGAGDAEMDDDEQDKPATADKNSSRWITSSDYLIQLTLNALLEIAARNPDSKQVQGEELEAVIQCTGKLTSTATRNAALLLLGKLATLRPKDTLDITLQVVAAVAESAQQQQDSQSLQIAADTLRAVAPAWTEARRGLPQLVEAALGVVDGLPLHRSILLLSALVSALPQEGGLQQLLASLLGRACGDGKQPSKGGEAYSQDRWLEIAGLVCKQVDWGIQVAVFRGLLEETLKGSKGHLEEGVPALATSLVASELGEGRAEAGTAEGTGMQEDLQAILQNALQRLQVLGSQMNGQLSRGQSAAVGTVTKLIKALEGVMPQQQYLGALMALLASPEEAIVTRALRLFQSSLAAPAVGEATEAAMQFCDQVEGMLSGKRSAKVKQSALVALSSLAAGHGKDSPSKILATVPAVLTQVSDSSWTLRSSALATLAAILNALGSAVIPLLPRLVPPVLSAAVAAAEQLPEVQAEDTEMGEAGEESSDEEGGPSAPRPSERQQLEVQAALGAVAALIHNLGPFLNPHLPALLHLLLDPRLLHLGTPACQLAGEARARLYQAVPARLLLPALIQHLDVATQEGAASVQELLNLTGRLVDSLDTAAAAASADAVWAFALQVLAFRQEPPAGLLSVRPVEEAAVQLVLSLTLKLTESRFKPLFLRLVDWAATPPSSGVAGPERQIVLFKLVNALAQQLRGVFVPYYRHLLTLMTTHLAGSGGSGKRKRSRTAGPAAAQAYAGPDAPFLRLQVVQALHKCFLYDQGDFLDEPLFGRLVTPLVAQLAFHLPPDVAARELKPQQAAQGAEAEEGLDAFGLAVVEAAVQMAVSVRAETMWKPLHHQILMATRSDDVMERRRALEVILQLVGRLGEEYVVLLPEAMPFLAELLEDPELHIQNGTRALLRKLEEITGEDLDEYLKM